MAKTSVFEPFFDDGLASINFFNGRLLSAEDLKTERHANREGHRRLAQAIGDGVVYGLEVRKSDASTAETPTVTVTAGLAINRTGDAIRLKENTELSLRTAQSAEGTPIVTVFRDCQPPRGGDYNPSSGAYLLAVRLLKGSTGLAPVSGLGNNAAGCNTKYLVEGVEFELHELSLGSDGSNPSLLRNLLAYSCFGVTDVADAVAAPFAPAVDDYGRAGTLRRQDTLSDCSVPLAIVYWTGAGLQFVDQWAVRRRPVPSDDQHNSWQVPIARRRSAEAEAMLFQFQEHLDALRRDLADPRTAVVTSHLRYLPPAGIVPIASSSPATGFEYPRFLQGCYRREPVYIDAARVEPLLRTAWQYPPIDLNDQHFVWLYWVRQNIRRIEQTPSDPPLRYLLFASGDMPFAGQARFDISRWNYSNYSLVEGALD